MKIYEGKMSEIDNYVNEYKEFCAKHNFKADIRGCIDFIMASVDSNIVDYEGNGEAELYKVLEPYFNTELDKAMKVVKSFGYKVIKESFDDISDEYKKLVQELAEKTGNDAEDAEVEDGAGIEGHAILVKFGDEEYECYDDYDDAVSAAKEEIKSLIEDCGGVMKVGFQWGALGGREQYLDEDDAENIVREDLENMLSDMSNREKRENYGKTDDDEIIEDQLGEINSYVDYIVDNWGEEQLDNLIKNGYISFDEDKLAEDCVEIDGPAHNLARYDGEEIELDGWWAYRVN